VSAVIAVAFLYLAVVNVSASSIPPAGAGSTSARLSPDRG
jgi:hypothetical protein